MCIFLVQRVRYESDVLHMGFFLNLLNLLGRLDGAAVVTLMLLSLRNYILYLLFLGMKNRI